MENPSRDRSKDPEGVSPRPSTIRTRERETDLGHTRPLYDPHVPDEAVLDDLKEQDPSVMQTPAGQAEAFRSTAGEELRPKDGTLDGGTAR